MIRLPPRSTPLYSSAASDVYKRQVFDGWFESRNKEYAGKLWSVWTPKMRAYMAKAAPAQAPKLSQDVVDDEVLRTGQSIGRFVGDTYRYSMPIVLGNN